MLPTTTEIEKVVSKYLFEPIDGITAAQIAEDLKIARECVFFVGHTLRLKIGDWIADVNVSGDVVSVSVLSKEEKAADSH